ncbi:MAG: tetratricopeptide repeat protein [Fimbriimonadaceae bacterium]|nr:tetratricopeptide repeat protein [Fimbriimonadaceae bacterium]QYK58300.1 MAG: tetratricopeptide repeat protein [Fimbriimonadaceae bacterium]
MSAAAQPDLFLEGLAAYNEGRLQDAQAWLREHTARHPHEPEGKHVLALVVSALGEKNEAERLLRWVIETKRSDAQAWSNYGDVLRQLGRIDDALEAHHRAVALDPNRAESLNNLGTVLFDQERYAEASEAFERALRLRSDYPEAHANLTQPLIETGRFAQARHSARTAVALDPSSASARICLGLAMVYGGQVEAGVEEFQRAVELDPSSDKAWGNLLLRAHSSSSHPAEQATAWAQEWGAMKPAGRPARPVEQIRRVGFVCGDFRNHPVGRFIEPYLANHSGRFEVFCYSNTVREDEVTARLKATRVNWRDVSQTQAEDVVRLVESDQIDLLIDLAGHTAFNRLDVFAHRAAPVQATWMGFPGTTGLSTMDWALVDPVLAPNGDERLYAERLVRLKGCFLPVPVPERLPESGAAPLEANGHVRFGSFNNPAKYSQAVYALWARILSETPSSVLVFKYRLFGDPGVRQSVTDQMALFGIGPERLEFLGATSRQDHLRAIASIDLVLDSFPYSGATTTLDCLTAGVPMVTMTGDRNASRMSASLLTALGETGLIASDPEEYVSIVAGLIEDPQALKETRARVSGALSRSKLCDPSAFVPDLESAFASMAA